MGGVDVRPCRGARQRIAPRGARVGPCACVRRAPRGHARDAAAAVYARSSARQWADVFPCWVWEYGGLADADGRGKGSKVMYIASTF